VPVDPILRRSENYLCLSECISRLSEGMWGGLRRPDPLRSIKATFKKQSIGFGPWREEAGKRLTAAALNGELTVYCTNSNGQIEDGKDFLTRPTVVEVVPVNVLKRLITVRSSLPDHAIRPSKKTTGGDIELFWLLITGVLVVDAHDFDIWYRSERRKHKWSSQQSTTKTIRGRPTRQTEAIKNAVLGLVNAGNWCRDDGIPKLHRLLTSSGRSGVPSSDTLARLVVALHRATGNRNLLRMPRRIRKQRPV
jgi:hypothetical protein